MIPNSVDAKTAELVKGLTRDVNAYAKPLREWYELFPESFYRIAPNLSLSKQLFVFKLMAKDPDCCRFVSDPDLLDLPEALGLSRNLLALAHDLDIRLARTAVDWMEESNRQGALRRCLMILHSLQPGSRINNLLVRLLASHDGVVRSKVLKLLLRTSLNDRSIRAWMQDPDPRIRADIIEFLSSTQMPPEWVHDVLLDHLSDPHGRIAANAAVELFRSGDVAAANAQLEKMVSSEDPSMRASAAWGMGQIPEANVSETLNRLRADADARVRWNALRSLSRVHKIAPKRAAETPVEPETPAETDEVVPAEVRQMIATPPPEDRGPVLNTRTFGRLL